jgi:hypothetical protein
MHLGLIDGPFIPHNPISTQESPVPFPRFQMAPWLKSQWPSGPKKEPGYTFLFPQKLRQSNSSRFPTRAPMKREVPLEEPLAERCPTTRAFLHSSIQILCIRAPSPRISSFPTTKGPPQGGLLASRDFLNISSRVPSDEAPSRPPTEPLQRERGTSSPEPPSSTP